MKKIKFYIILISTLIISKQNADAQSVYPVEKGRIDSLYSNILKASRELYIQLPENFDASGKKEYPVLYVLDGEYLMDAASAVYKYYWGGFIPEMFIVGVANLENRRRDLITDSAQYFTAFLEQELIPHMEANYPVTGYRSLIGHSYSGYFTISTLIKNGHLFENYLAIDPSLDFDDHNLLDQAKKAFAERSFEGKALFVSLGGQLHMQNPGIHIDNVMQDTSEFTLFARSNIELARSAEAKPQNGLDFHWKFYPNDLHMSIPLPSIRDGMISLFDWFQMEETHRFNDPETPADELMKVIRQRAEKLEEHFGYKVPPYEEELLNVLGYMSLDMGYPKRSLAFFLLCIEYFPLSVNAYDSLSEYYVAQNDFENALKYASTAFELSGSEYHKKKMTEYKQQIAPEK